MSFNWRIGHGRNRQNHIDGSTIDRIKSPDGNRWAYSRARKRRLGGGQYDSVVSWVIRQRVDGKVVTINTDAFEQHARDFVAGLRND
jgi:hypothetical protein